jgi:hypothetical protein
MQAIKGTVVDHAFPLSWPPVGVEVGRRKTTARLVEGANGKAEMLEAGSSDQKGEGKS